MKKALMVFGIFILLMSSVMAGFPPFNPNPCGLFNWDDCEWHEIEDEFPSHDDLEEVDEDSKDRDIDIIGYIENNEYSWLKDTVGSSGSGFGESRLGSYLVGDGLFFYWWDGTFLDFLRNVFVTKSELQELEDYVVGLEQRTYSLQRRVYELEKEVG
jgi:hypothetical protein